MSILTLPNLAIHPTRTADHQVKMSLLAEYYEHFLFPNYYDFKLGNNSTVRIDFHKDHFCHLVGVGQIAEAKFTNPNDNRLFMHKGKKGFKRAKTGKLEFSYLKNLHQHEYAKQEDKFFFFHFLHTMMDSGDLKLVNYTPITNSTIHCHFMFHDEYDNALLHLGVERSSKTGNFFPKTFFARYVTSTTADKYIRPQTPIGITSLTKVPR